MTDKVRNGGTWTEGRYRSFIISALRGGMRRWQPKWKALASASVGKKTNKATGRLALHYKCAKCNKNYPSSNVQVDHIEPVVDPATGFVSWDVYIERMYCEVENLQVLCKKCHLVKTKEEKNAKRE